MEGTDSVGKKKINTANFGLSNTKNLIPLKARCLVYNILVVSHLNYCCTIFGSSPLSELRLLSTVQNKAIRNVALAKYNAHTEPIFKQLGYLTFLDLVDYNRAVFAYKFRHDLLPDSFAGFFMFQQQEGENRTRNNDGNFILPQTPKKVLGPHAEVVKVWNALPFDLKSIP